MFYFFDEPENLSNPLGYTNWNGNLSIFIKNLLLFKDSLIEIESAKTLKNFDKAKLEFESALNLIPFLNRFKFYDNKSEKELYVAHPKYDFWNFLIFSIGLKIYGKYKNLNFLYFSWANDLINFIKKINLDFKIDSWINFINVENFKSSYSNDNSNTTKVLSFTSLLNNERYSIPNFSTCIVSPGSDIDIVSEFILQNAFDFVGFKENSIKRVLVHVSILDSFIHKLLKKFSFYIKVDSTIVSQKYKYSLRKLYLEAISDGAEVLWGSTLEDDKFEYNTVLLNVNPNMRIYSKKYFGPILCIVPFNDNLDDLKYLLNRQPSKGLILFGDDLSGEINLNFRILNKFESMLQKYHDSDSVLANTQLIYLLENKENYQI